MKRSNGGERMSKCRKDEDHDLWYGPGPPVEFKTSFMCCLSHWSGQEQNFLQRLQELGAQEMQWDHAWQRTLITDVHSARELQAPWTADHLGKSKSDLTSWRW